MAIRKTTKLLSKDQFNSLEAILATKRVNLSKEYDKKNLAGMIKELKLLNMKIISARKKLTPIYEKVESAQDIFHRESTARAMFYSSVLAKYLNP